jgi:hypothetical protein
MSWDRRLDLHIDVDAPSARTLLASATDTSVLSVPPELVAGDLLTVRVFFWTRGATPGSRTAIDPGATATFVLSGRTLDVPPDSPLLFLATAFTELETGVWQTTLDLNTAAIAAHLAASPAGAKVITAELEIRDAADTARRSIQFRARLMPQVWDNQNPPSAAAPTDAVRHSPQTLTGQQQAQVRANLALGSSAVLDAAPRILNEFWDPANGGASWSLGDVGGSEIASTTLVAQFGEACGQIAGDAGFATSDLQRVTFPVTRAITLGDLAFSECPNLSAVGKLPPGSTVGSGCFYACSALADIDFLPADMTVIPHQCFNSAGNPFAAVTIPAGITGIGTEAFAYASWAGVSLPAGLLSVGDGAFSNCFNLQAVVIPDSVTAIGPNAFYGCTSMVSVTLPAGLTEVAVGCFQECSVSEINIPPAVVRIDHYAFSGALLLTSIVLPAALADIGDGAFENTGLLRVDCHATTAPNLGNDPFGATPSIQELHVPAGATGYGAAPWTTAFGTTYFDL